MHNNYTINKIKFQDTIKIFYYLANDFFQKGGEKSLVRVLKIIFEKELIFLFVCDIIIKSQSTRPIRRYGGIGRRVGLKIRR